MSLADNFLIRSMRVTDIPRIFRDWLQSYHSATEIRHVPNPVYYHWHHKLLESLMVDETVVWLVACDAANPDLITGWLCAQQFAGDQYLVHYVYVPKTYRRFGLASRLLATLGLAKDVGVMVTANTNSGTMLLRSRGNQPVYNPYLLLGRAVVPVNESESRRDIRAALKKSYKASRIGFNINETPEERT